MSSAQRIRAGQPGHVHLGQITASGAQCRRVPQHGHTVQAPGADRDFELAALAIGAGNGNAAPQQFRQTPGNAQAQPGAAVLPGNGGTALGEGIEQPAQLLRFHADAGIGYPGNQQFPRSVATNGQGNRTLFRELQGITAQVDNDLPEAGGVGMNLLGQGKFTGDMEIQPLFPGLGREKCPDIRQELGHVHRHDVHVEFVGVDLRVIQDVVDQIQ